MASERTLTVWCRSGGQEQRINNTGQPWNVPISNTNRFIFSELATQHIHLYAIKDTIRMTIMYGTMPNDRFPISGEFLKSRYVFVVRLWLYPDPITFAHQHLRYHFPVTPIQALCINNLTTCVRSKVSLSCR